MKRFIFTGAWLACLAFGATVMADGTIQITGIEAPLHYDGATGEITILDGFAERRIGRPLWSATEQTGLVIIPDDEYWLDCGDVEMDTAAQTFGFAYVTNCQEGAGTIGIWMDIYINENNYDTQTRELAARLIFDDLPGSTHPANEYWGYAYTATMSSYYSLDGADLDADGLQDFGYSYFIHQHPDGLLAIPTAGNDGNSFNPPAPGAEPGWDIFGADANGDGVYLYHGGDDQLYFEMYEPGCPNAGPSGRYCSADIVGYDCIVNVADLAQLLGHYGMTTGATRQMGDVDPYDENFPGDGDVDLGDLSEVLSQYGENCNW